MCYNVNKPKLYRAQDYGRVGIMDAKAPLFEVIPEKTAGGSNVEKLNVAIADDNERMLQALGEIVKSDEELQVVGTAKDGEEAYEMIKKKEPDVVLLDIVMPKLDGLMVMNKIRNDKNIKKYPAFIMITAIGQEKITEDAFSMGADYYIMKPFDNDVVINRIKHVRTQRFVK